MYLFFSSFSSTFPRFITLRRLSRFVNTTKFAKKRFLGFISYHLLLSRSYAIIYPTSNWPPHDFFYMQRPSRKISISVWSFKNWNSCKLLYEWRKTNSSIHFNRSLKESSAYFYNFLLFFTILFLRIHNIWRMLLICEFTTVWNDF